MLSIIVAFDRNQLIGKNNKMPWHYKEDLAYFRKTTLNHKVVMGRKTFESILTYINKPLPGRDNIVISTSGLTHEGVEVYSGIEQFLKKYKDTEEEVFIIGGKSIYEQFIDYVDCLYITHIDKEFEGDTYFPTYDLGKWEVIRERKENDLRFSVYARKVESNE